MVVIIGNGGGDEVVCHVGIMIVPKWWNYIFWWREMQSYHVYRFKHRACWCGASGKLISDDDTNITFEVLSFVPSFASVYKLEFAVGIHSHNIIPW